MLAVKYRTWLTVISWLLYLGLFNIYIYELTHGLSHRRCILMYSYLTGIMIAICFIDRIYITTWPVHRQFNILSIISILANFVLIILTQHNILTNAKEMFYIFNGLIIAFTLMIISSIHRYGLYQD